MRVVTGSKPAMTAEASELTAIEESLLSLTIVAAHDLKAGSAHAVRALAGSLTASAIATSPADAMSRPRTSAMALAISSTPEQLVMA